jgi:hypothetical protein
MQDVELLRKRYYGQHMCATGYVAVMLILRMCKGI